MSELFSMAFKVTLKLTCLGSAMASSQKMLFSLMILVVLGPFYLYSALGQTFGRVFYKYQLLVLLLLLLCLYGSMYIVFL